MTVMSPDAEGSAGLGSPGAIPAGCIAKLYSIRLQAVNRGRGGENSDLWTPAAQGERSREASRRTEAHDDGR